MCTLLAEIFVPRYEGKYTLGRSVDGPSEGLFYLNNRAHINYKAGSNVAPGGKYPLQDLISAAHATRFVRTE